jgi:hypothetical protein
MWLYGVLRQLPLPENGNNGVAYAINNRNHAAGVANLSFIDPSVPQEPLFWRDGGVTILPYLQATRFLSLRQSTIAMRLLATPRRPVAFTRSFCGSTERFTTCTHW